MYDYKAMYWDGAIYPAQVFRLAFNLKGTIVTDKIEFEKTVRDGKVAIIVSPGYGAGWSTWGTPAQFLAMDSGLVALVERRATADEVEEYLKTKLDKVPYMGGWGDTEIQWLPVGTQFYIHEYDGSESLRTHDDLVWTA